ncbi:probable G-protein coupled receptor Mth-like 7 isoform X2 [Drosophila rhopaloa]|uniref:Probable G-protein coupled receptor Mth-like 7 isoform X2 n=1 Tax=Drosophila rhopaloa TaxID=1041015 RepID=A0A6P4EG11_DRORH|nr:probable G-protein coupled receptor Mth-like 7 isoform X2 [Drosophila rhopaloa]
MEIQSLWGRYSNRASFSAQQVSSPEMWLPLKLFSTLIVLLIVNESRGETLNRTDSDSTKKLGPAVSQIAVVSLLCYILTIAVYLYVKELRNRIGKCFICCLFCLFMKCLIWMLDVWGLLEDFRGPAGYVTHFFWAASFLWFSFLNCYFKDSFKELKGKIPRIPFLVYNAFVWSAAAILTGVVLLINHFREHETRFQTQYFVTIKPLDFPTVIYFYGPMLILSILNVSLSISKLMMIRREVEKLNPFQRSLSFATCIRLSTIWGLTWSLDLFLCIMQAYDFWPDVLWVSDYFHAAFGISIFVIFIVRNRTLQWLREENTQQKPQIPDVRRVETSI